MGPTLLSGRQKVSQRSGRVFRSYPSYLGDPLHPLVQLTCEKQVSPCFGACARRDKE